MRIASPPTQWPCYYGVDTPTRSELIAATHSIEEINQYITSDTLAYLSLSSLTGAVMDARATARGEAGGDNGAPRAVSGPALDERSFCHACWSGDYPITFTPAEKKLQLPLLHI